jgi:hypothetical protein
MANLTFTVGNLAFSIAVDLPELVMLGEHIMDAAQQISEAIDRAEQHIVATVQTEAGEIAAVLQGLTGQVMTDATVQDLVGRLDGMGERVGSRVRDLVTPETPPVPVPDPGV